ncbi:MAG: cytochrome-c oxidase [Candidatus Hydrogenedentota bacterium]|nr:MAG: cytochrome-c oxidase [Candidatus Hydrogenedentota bacterium]
MKDVMETTAEKPHASPYGTYILVWLCLMGLTGLTVAVSGVHLGNWNAAGAVAIASTKAAVVIWYFMHLRYDKSIFRWMVLVMIITLGIILGLTFIDSTVRGPF